MTNNITEVTGGQQMHCFRKHYSSLQFHTALGHSLQNQ